MRWERARAQGGVVVAVLACVGVVSVVAVCLILGARDIVQALL